jgi:hypothetical protein
MGGDMKTSLRNSGLVLVLGSCALVAAAATAPGPNAVDGRWDAALVDNGPAVSFRLDIAGAGQKLTGTFYDGFHPYDSTTSVTFKEGKLVPKAEHYLTTITAALSNGELNGDALLQGPGYTLKYGFHAVRHVNAPVAAVNAPSIGGSWIIPLDAPSSKGEKAFRFIVQQHGADVAASILRIDGDTGAYSGTFVCRMRHALAWPIRVGRLVGSGTEV